MGKSVDDLVLDGGLSYVKWFGTFICVCSEAPDTYAKAVSTEMLAWTTRVSGDYTVQNGSVSGRRVTMNSAISFAVSNTGSAQHVAIVTASTTSKVLLVTTCTNQTLTAGNTLTVPEWDYEIADPT